MASRTPRGRAARAPASWVVPLALLLCQAGSVRLEGESSKESWQASAFFETVAEDNPPVRGGPNAHECEVFTDPLGNGGQACTADEFLRKSWVVAMDLDCVLSTAQKNLDFLTKRYELEAQAETHRWNAFESELYCALVDKAGCKARPKLRQAEFPSKLIYVGRTARNQMQNSCREDGPEHEALAEVHRRTQYHWPSVCDLLNCRPSSNSTGHMIVTLPNGRKLLMLPQPASMGWAYSYDGNQVRASLDSADEVTSVDMIKISKGIWFASLLTWSENMKEDLYFLGEQHRVQYVGHDPAIITRLTHTEGKAFQGMCIGASNNNLIDPGNADEFFPDPLDVKSVRNADIRPYWRLSRHSYFAGVGSKVVLDGDGVPMGTISIDVNLNKMAQMFLNNLNLTSNSYAVFVDRFGNLLGMDRNARRILLDGRPEGDIFDLRPRCKKGMTKEQLKTCSWEPLKSVKLADITIGTNLAAANFSRLLRKMFDGTSMCNARMQHADILFAPTLNGWSPLDPTNHPKAHLVAGCSFGTVPGWGLIMGTPHMDILESAGIRVNYKRVRSSKPGGQLGHESSMIVGHNSRELLLSTKLSMAVDWGDPRQPNQTVWLTVKNIGNIEIPLTTFVVDKVSREFLFVDQKSGGESFTLAPEASRDVKVLMCLSCLHDFGTYTGTVHIQANRDWSRGICLPDPYVVRVQVKMQEPYMIKAMKKLAIYLFLPLSCIIIGKVLHSSVRHRYKTEALQSQVIEEAIGSFSKIPHPMVLMSATCFKRLGRLVSHEEAQERHETLWLYTIEEVEEFSSKNHVVFISHQWTAFGVPDPSNTQYRAMVMSLETLCTQKMWQEQNVYIWVDYISIPQRHSGTQLLAINSLTVYSSRVAAFVVVAPEVVHKDLQEVCDKATYQCRAWCRAEQLSHLLARGTQNMYLAEHDELTPLTNIQGWLEQSTYVFHGDLTCCRRRHEGMLRCDKEFLVTPMLGLWAQLCLRVEDSSRALEPGMQEAIQIHAAMGQNLNAIFPRTFWFARATGFKERPLFSDLTDRLQVALAEGSHEEADVRAKIA